MIEEDVEILGHIEERHRLAMVLVRHCAEFKLDGLALRHEGDADQFVGRNIFGVGFCHWIFSFSGCTAICGAKARRL